MTSAAESRRAPRGRASERPTATLACTALGSTVLVALLLVTASASDTRLGAPSYWTWVLTGLQVTALWGAGSGHGWAWPLGAAMQPPWIAYAVVTGQVGFIAGCVVSGAVQTANIVRQANRLREAGDVRQGPLVRPSDIGRAPHVRAAPTA